MEKKWLTCANNAIGLLIVILLISAIGYASVRPREISTSAPETIKRSLPKHAYAQSQEAYNQIGQTILQLKQAPLTMQLPDLKKHLSYYGKNDRPDAKETRPFLHFSFTGNKTVTSILPGDKAYVLYDRKVNPPQYIFSPENKETSLWIQPTANEQEAQVKVSMRSENGEIIEDPSSHAQFSLLKKEYVRTGGTTWELGKWRVDGSLLARQKARWYGGDRFLENHGGEEYSQYTNKQRLDFGEGSDIYSVFIGPNHGIIWIQDKWQAVTPGKDSLGYPLMIIKKMDDRLVQFELWDADGQSKTTLNLLKSTEPWTPQNVLQNFKFLGSRTRSQFVFEVNKERMHLSPKDWLVLTNNTWKKLSTPEEIDDYVNRKLVGVLFIFDGIERRDEQQVLLGTLYNSSRSESKPVEIVIGSTPINRRKVEKVENVEETLDEESPIEIPRPKVMQAGSLIPNAIRQSEKENIDYENNN